MKTTFQNGNREVTATIIGSNQWTKDNMSRVYFDIAFTGAKLDPIAKIYDIIEGPTKDATVEISGRVFGYQIGIGCDSKTKKASATEAAKDLISQIAAQ